MKIALPVLFLAIAAGAWAQEGPMISKKVNVVSLLATVHDRDGKVVKNLSPDDFTLLEDGVPQKIDYFTQEADLPLTVGLLVDTSRSQTGVLEQERTASYAFLDQVLREDKDQAFVAHFDTRVEVLQGLTSSRSELASTCAISTASAIRRGDRNRTGSITRSNSPPRTAIWSSTPGMGTTRTETVRRRTKTAARVVTRRAPPRS